MKAAVKKSIQNKLKLSIGLIVKNEEETLEKCLQSLSKLREAVPSELIIADTGSTDRTVEIAEKYADQVFTFPWCDDFAAARNSTLDRASGEWYMFLDADEWFESTDKIEAFLKANVQKSEYAAYFVRNYGTIEGKDFNDSVVVRLFKRAPNRRFVGSIHEQIVMDGNCELFRNFVHHYGYVDSQKKVDRNKPMLEKALLINPQDRKARYQLFRELICGDELEAALVCSDVLLEQLSSEDSYSNMLRATVLVLRMEVFTRQQNLSKILETGELFLQEKMGDHCSDIEMHFYMSYAYAHLERYEDAYHELQEYFRFCRLYEEEKLDIADIMVNALHTYPSTGLFQAVHRFILCCYHLEKHEELLAATEWMPAEEYKNGDDAIILMEFKAILEAKRFDLVWTRYERIKAWESKEQTDLIRKLIDEMLLCSPEAMAISGKAFMEYAPMDDCYGNLIGLRYQDAYEIFDCGICGRLAAQYPQEEQYGEILYFFMKYAMDLSALYDRIEIEEAKALISYMFRIHSDADEIIRQYYQNAPMADNLLELRWELSLLERTALRKEMETKSIFGGSIPLIFTDKIEDDLMSTELFERYARDMGRYVCQLYQPEVLQENLSVLPRVHRFGYMMEKAYHLRDKADIVGFLKALVKAGEYYPVMLPYIKRIKDTIQKELDDECERQAERELLMEQIKEKIRYLTELEQYDKASQILVEYSKVNPDDAEIPSLYARIAATSVSPS